MSPNLSPADGYSREVARPLRPLSSSDRAAHEGCSAGVCAIRARYRRGGCEQVEGRSNDNTTARAIRGSSLLLIGRLISIASNVVVRVVLAQHFLKSELGVLLFALSVSDMVRAIVALGQDRAMSHHLVIYGEDRKQGYVFGTVLLRGPNVVWAGDLRVDPIRKKGGKK